MVCKFRQAVLLGFFALLVLQPVSSWGQNTVLDRILQYGVLRVGTTGDWLPMSVRDPENGGYIGYDIDLTSELAKDLGVSIEYVRMDWGNLTKGLHAGHYDITTSASLTPARAARVAFSESYFSLATVPLTLRANDGRFNTWADLNQPGVTIAATLGTSQEQLIKEFFPLARHWIVVTPRRDYEEVLAGRADAHITSDVEALQLIEAHRELMIVPVEAPRAPTPVGMMLPRNDQVWINYVNSWIRFKEERGYFKELAKKWNLRRR
ncbi:transporter substrate-binding domain-containing protein [Pseudovibrio sp. SPO723]|uniref:transporter substrate-binding domain-containing protein n=1 Tax=Nesiotobacter zosterae TaxID=392721 RepID=UPI0029C443E9|nr:transporter substrate-binding domain-containing protein [Pseudovibrio sp. SPO723]MDX5595202.1 transporter substrate-binding domain-containing protein [Pseudovibrio sp. SPO723]